MKKKIHVGVMLVFALAQLACVLPFELPFTLPFGLGGGEDAPTLTPAAQPTLARTITLSPSGAATAMPPTVVRTAETVSKSATIPASGGRISDRDGFYTLTAVQGWKLAEQMGGQTLCADDQGTTCLLVRLHSDALFPEYVLEAVLADLEGSHKAFVEVSRSDITLGGYDGMVSKVRYNRNGTSVAGEVRVVTRNRVGYEVSSWAPQDKYESVQAIFSTMIRSFTVTEFKTSPTYDQWNETLSENLAFYSLEGSYADQNAKSIAAAYERAYLAIQKALKLDYFGPIDYYLYPNLGALYLSTYRTSAFAIEDASEVHAVWTSSTEHSPVGREMARVIATNTLGYAGQPLMGEGLAACLDQEGADYRLLGKALINNGKYVALAKMMGEAWYGIDPAVAQPQSGAFVCYLLSQHGAEAVWDFYISDNLDEAAKLVLGKDLAGLEKDFKAWLGK